MSSSVDETYGIDGLKCRVCGSSTYFGRDGLCSKHLSERPDAAPREEQEYEFVEESVDGRHQVSQIPDKRCPECVAMMPDDADSAEVEATNDILKDGGHFAACSQLKALADAAPPKEPGVKDCGCHWFGTRVEPCEYHASLLSPTLQIEVAKCVKCGGCADIDICEDCLDRLAAHAGGEPQPVAWRARRYDQMPQPEGSKWTAYTERPIKNEEVVEIQPLFTSLPEISKKMVERGMRAAKGERWIFATDEAFRVVIRAILQAALQKGEE